MIVDRLRSFDRRLEARLPLKGYLHLYQAHLRSERQALKTIEVYSSGLHKFEAWFRATYEAEPALADFSGDQVRFFNNNMAVSG